MNKEHIKELIIAAPFRPFIIHTSSGRAIEVIHPEQVTLLPGRMMVATGYLGNREAEGVEHIAYLHVSNLQEK